MYKTSRIVPVLAMALALSVVLSLMLSPRTARAEEAQEYVKNTTYIAGLESGIEPDDRNWELLYDAVSKDGKISGSAASESGIYGVGFKHKTPGRGTSVISADITVPEAKNDKTGFVEIALRLNSMTDGRLDKKGFRICIEGGGKIGILYASANKKRSQQTKYTFTDGRKIYIEDNADENVITLFVDDAGQKVKVAECVIDGQRVTMFYADEGLEPVSTDFGFDIYRDGFVSITDDAQGMYISDLSVTVPSFSSVPYASAEEIVSGGNAPAGFVDTAIDIIEGDDDVGRPGGVNASLIVYPVLSVLLLALVIVCVVMLVKKPKEGESA